MSQADQLHNHLANLDAALAQLEALAASSPALAASVRSLTIQRTELTTQLAELQRTHLSLVFDGAGVNGHEMDAGVLGKVLRDLQQTVSSIGQSVIKRATRVGPLATGLKTATQLNFAASFAGSVGIELHGPAKSDGTPMIELDSILDTSLYRLLEALALAADEKSTDDQILESVLPWGSRAYKHLRALASTLADDELDAQADLSTESGRQHSVSVPRWAAKRLTQVLKLADLTESEVTVEGHLGTVSDFRNRVEIVTASGAILNAKVAEEIVPSLRDFYAQEVRAVIEMNTSKERATGVERTYRTVRHLSLARPQPTAVLPESPESDLLPGWAD